MTLQMKIKSRVRTRKRRVRQSITKKQPFNQALTLITLNVKRKRITKAEAPKRVNKPKIKIIIHAMINHRK